MSKYVRPTVPPQTFLDADGEVIEYGNRWPDGDGPAETYEMFSHPERFKPIHDVADALIRYLSETFDVEVSDEQDPARPEFRRADDGQFERCVRVTPKDRGASPLTLLFASSPSLLVHAGLMHWAPYPDCGCDHCDETAEQAADELEQLVFAVVGGGLRESLSPDWPPTRSHELFSAHGELNESRHGPENHISIEEARRIRLRLEEIGGQWNAWPPRSRPRRTRARRCG